MDQHRQLPVLVRAGFASRQEQLSRRASAAPGPSTMRRLTVIRGGYGLYYPEDLVFQLHAHCLVWSDVRLVHRDLPDEQGRFGSVAGPVPDRSIPGQRPRRESGAARTSLSGWDDDEEHRHRQFRQPRSRICRTRIRPASGSKNSYRDASRSAPTTSICQHRDLYMLQESESGSSCERRPHGDGDAHHADVGLQRGGARARQPRLVRLQRAADEHPEAFQPSLPVPRCRIRYSRAEASAAHRVRPDTINLADGRSRRRRVIDLHLDDRFQLATRTARTSCRSTVRSKCRTPSGLILSGVWQYNSGTPFTLTDSTTDPNRNGNFEEPLPAGTYQRRRREPERDHGREQGWVQRRARSDFSLMNMRAAVSVQAAATAGHCRPTWTCSTSPIARTSTTRPATAATPHVPDPALDPQRRADADRTVQPSIRLLKRLSRDPIVLGSREHSRRCGRSGRPATVVAAGDGRSNGFTGETEQRRQRIAPCGQAAARLARGESRQRTITSGSVRS